MPSRSKIRRIRRPCFNIDGCATLWTIALKRPFFKRKKGFANISLGLNYCSMGSSWPRFRDTGPLRGKNTEMYIMHGHKFNITTIIPSPMVLAREANIALIIVIGFSFAHYSHKQSFLLLADRVIKLFAPKTPLRRTLQ
jgi:hypothetical protein